MAWGMLTHARLISAAGLAGLQDLAHTLLYIGIVFKVVPNWALRLTNTGSHITTGGWGNLERHKQWALDLRPGVWIESVSSEEFVSIFANTQKKMIVSFLSRNDRTSTRAQLLTNLMVKLLNAHV